MKTGKPNVRSQDARPHERFFRDNLLFYHYLI